MTAAEGRGYGFSQIPNWMLRDPDVSIYAKVVYAEIVSNISRNPNDANAGAWPSHATIAREMNISVATVKRALEELKSLGVVRSWPRYKDDGSRTSNGYWADITPRFPDDPQFSQSDPLAHTERPPSSD